MDLPYARSDKVYIISCAEDRDLLQEYSTSGWDDHFISTEFVLSGALRQELDFTAHRLSVKGGGRGARGGKRR